MSNSGRLKGGQMFCRIRNYISTAQKQDGNILDSLIEVEVARDY